MNGQIAFDLADFWPEVQILRVKSHLNWHILWPEVHIWGAKLHLNWHIDDESECFCLWVSGRLCVTRGKLQLVRLSRRCGQLLAWLFMSLSWCMRM